MSSNIDPRQLVGAGLLRRGGHGIVNPSGSLALPALVGSLEGWYRADSGITTVGGAVSSWADQSGKGRTLTQAVGSAQPTHVPSNSAFNNQASVSFDGGDTLAHSTASDWAFMSNGGGMTLVLVAKGDAADTIYSFSGTNTTISNVGSSVRTNGVGTMLWDMGNGSVNILGNTVQSNVDDALFKIILRYEEGRAGNEYATRYNGGTDSTGNSSAAPSASDPVLPLTFGNFGALTFTGDIAECILYSKYITNVEADSIDGYLLNRYGV